jgi:hypothetical protein
MEHDEAIRSQAAERYAARELLPAERTAFEAHFFDCPECADEVRIEMQLVANLRGVLREMRAEQGRAPAAAKFWGKWRRRCRPQPAIAFSFAVSLALAAGLGYVLLTGAHPAAAPHFVAVYFAPGPAHGAADVHVLPKGETTYGVRFPAPSAAIQSYTCEILDASGKRESARTLPALASLDGFLWLDVPVDGLPGGVHTLVVRGSGGETFSWSKFRTTR